MSDSVYGLVEMLLFFGLLLAFLFWQLIVTRRSLREDRERADCEARDGAESPTGVPGRTEDNR